MSPDIKVGHFLPSSADTYADCTSNSRSTLEALSRTARFPIHGGSFSCSFIAAITSLVGDPSQKTRPVLFASEGRSNGAAPIPVLLCLDESVLPIHAT